LLLVLLAACALAGALVAARALFSSSSHRGTPLALNDVSTSVLVREGIHLSRAKVEPSVSRAAAERTASSAEGGDAVRQSVPAHCTVSNTTPTIDQVCWVVALDPSRFHPPSNGPPGASPVKMTYVVVLVDWTTGAWLLTEFGNPSAAS
jgi:hypothetical protein